MRFMYFSNLEYPYFRYESTYRYSSRIYTADAHRGRGPKYLSSKEFSQKFPRYGRKQIHSAQLAAWICLIEES